MVLPDTHIQISGSGPKRASLALLNLLVCLHSFLLFFSFSLNIYLFIRFFETRFLCVGLAVLELAL